MESMIFPFIFLGGTLIVFMNHLNKFLPGSLGGTDYGKKLKRRIARTHLVAYNRKYQLLQLIIEEKIEETKEKWVLALAWLNA